MTQPKALSREALVAFCDAVEAILPGAFTPTEVYQRALNRIDEDLGAVRALLEPAADVDVEKWLRLNSFTASPDGGLHDYDVVRTGDVRELLAASLRAERGWSPGVEAIAAERRRQIDVEGWSAKHDDRATKEELALVAANYALPPSLRFTVGSLRLPWPDRWPYKWWKPCPNNRIRELEKAGALIAAEIDRLRRLPTPPSDGGKEG